MKLRHLVTAAISVVLVAILGLNPVLGQTSQRVTARFSPNDQVSAKTTLADGTSIEVVVVRTKFSEGAFPYSTAIPRTAWCGWGADMKPPSTVVTSVQVKVADKMIWVRMSSFSDLGDPDAIQIEDTSVGLEVVGEFVVDKSAFRLIVFGGQSDTAYRAELHFNANRLERRLVWEGEYPDQVAEETIYRTGG